MDALALEHELTLTATVADAQSVGPGPWGTRMVARVVDGTVVGGRINGTVEGPGADWLVLGADGLARVDVRLQIRTDDGVLVYAHYEGMLEVNDKVVAALGDPAGETSWEDQYFRTSPRFEVGHDRYRWLQESWFVARGRITCGGVEYEVYRVV
jgi:Protein of unknown function (DUF3237)